MTREELIMENRDNWEMLREENSNLPSYEEILDNIHGKEYREIMNHYSKIEDEEGACCEIMKMMSISYLEALEFLAEIKNILMNLDGLRKANVLRNKLEQAA